MTKMMKEVLSQKDKLSNTYLENKDKVLDIAKIIKDKNISHIEIVARGSSRNACEYFKYLLEMHSSIRVGFVYPSTVTKYNGTLNKDTLYLAVSQGGKGEDLKIIINEANRIGATTIAITNEENSPLNEIANYNLYMKVDKELSMAATKTFSAEMLLLGMLAFAITNKDISIFNNIGKIIDNLDQNKIEKVAEKLSQIKNLFVLSRGRFLAIAKETCCKLQETCFINANPYATSDFMHGPLALVDKDFYSIVIIPNDETKNDVVNLLELIKKNNGHTIVLTNDSILNGDDTILLKETLDERYLFEVTFAIQLLACFTTIELGTNPDLSRNLNKYTKTI